MAMEGLELFKIVILKALEKIEKGEYGTCEVCAAEIEEDRLEANPSARTCKAHVDEEGGL